jgi:hypothetical protein
MKTNFKSLMHYKNVCKWVGDLIYFYNSQLCHVICFHYKWTHTKCRPSTYWHQLLSFYTAGNGLTPIIVIFYTKYWSDTNNSYSLLQVLVWHYLKLFFQQILVWHHLWLFSTPSIGLIPIVVILYTKYWSDTSYSYSPMQLLVWHQL